MHKFTDTAGDSWVVEINGGTVRRAERYLGIDLGKPRAGDRPWLSRFDDAEEIAFKVDLIYVICMPQIRERGWTDEEFAELLAGECLREASVAVYGALTDFFLQLGSRENAIATQAQIAMLPEVYGAAASRGRRFLTGVLGSTCASSLRSPADSTRSDTASASCT